MGNDNKVQGEGDYDSARRFNKQEQEFVKKGVKPPAPLDSAAEAEGQAAEQQGKARRKDRGHDAKDADLFRKGESSRH